MINTRDLAQRIKERIESLQSEFMLTTHHVECKIITAHIDLLTDLRDDILSSDPDTYNEPR